METINSVKHKFSSAKGEYLIENGHTFVLREYAQTIDGKTYKGQYKWWVSPKSGMYYERFIFNGVEYNSEAAFARAALSTVDFDALMSELDEINDRYFTDEMWNDADQRERDEMAKPACFAFTLNHKEMTPTEWGKFFDYLEDFNYHTERKLLKKILGM
jgi:hypothetical protein